MLPLPLGNELHPVPNSTIVASIQFRFRVSSEVADGLFEIHWQTLDESRPLLGPGLTPYPVRIYAKLCGMARE